jgi:hypothetical protein
MPETFNEPCAKRLKREKKEQHFPEPWTNCWEAAKDFYAFVYERQMIWQRRNQGQDPPWTDDLQMATDFFCNVYRELDRGTAYFRQQIHRKNAARKLESVLWLSAVYRLLNKIETFEGKLAGGEKWAMGIPPQQAFPEFAKYLTRCMDKKVPVFTSAHQNSGLRRYLDTLHGLRTKLGEYCTALRQCESLEACYNEVKKLPNVGAFFAWQILCDLIESSALPQAFTEQDWVALGPGAKAGLQRIFPPTW